MIPSQTCSAGTHSPPETYPKNQCRTYVLIWISSTIITRSWKIVTTIIITFIFIQTSKPSSAPLEQSACLCSVTKLRRTVTNPTSRNTFRSITITVKLVRCTTTTITATSTNINICICITT